MDNLPEALGIAWCELFKIENDSGVQKVVKINLTARSMIGPEDALDKLVLALETAKGKGYYPYIKQNERK